MKYPLPGYPGGKQFTYTDGSGLCDDALTEHPADESYITVIEGTDEAAFFGYIGTLCAQGWRVTWERDADAGTYRELTKDDALLYLYYVPAEHTVRIVEDNASVPLGAFGDASPAPGGGERLMQFGLYYNEMVPGVTCDCGMNYTLMLSDGSFLIIDGGEFEQSTDAAVAEYMARLRALCGDERIRVALWFCTHPHNDHMDFFLKFLRVYGDFVTLERVAFNFPSSKSGVVPPYITGMRARITAFAPDVTFLKLHTGQRFWLRGTAFDVLLTQEDVLHPEGERRYSGTNQTSAVVKITTQGFSFTVLGDIPEENGDILVRRYAAGEADCTFLQAAHHCINRIENVYAHVKADFVLIPEETAMLHRHMEENLQVIRKYHAPDTILPAGDKTRVFWTQDGRLCTESFPVVGGAYDGSGI